METRSSCDICEQTTSFTLTEVVRPCSDSCRFILTQATAYTREYTSIIDTLLAWVWEILCCVFGLVCLIAIVIILLRVNHKEQHQYIVGVPINAIVAFLATSCRVAFTGPLVEGISQLKWNSFSHGEARPLGQLQAFDHASRGAFGTLRLLLVTKSNCR